MKDFFDEGELEEYLNLNGDKQTPKYSGNISINKSVKAVTTSDI